MESLTERDIINELKYGEDVRSTRIHQTVIRLKEEETEYEELIRCASLHSPRLDGAVAANRELAYDRVPDAVQEARMMMEDCRRNMAREVRAIRRSEQRSCSVWGSFRRLDQFHRTVLHRYYIEKESSRAIAQSLQISEATFWRKRKEAVTEMLRMCGNAEEIPEA